MRNVISRDGKTIKQAGRFVDAHGRILTQIQALRRRWPISLRSKRITGSAQT